MNRKIEPMSHIEPISKGISRVWDIYETIFEQKTAYQTLKIVNTAHGATLFCDNERQSSELSQLAYHEGQVMPALLSMATLPKKALVIGSSEGVAIEILQQAGVEQIIHVDIDEDCLKACSKYLPYGYTPEDVELYLAGTESTRIIIDDGYRFIQSEINAGNTYDLVVMDIPDEGINTQALYEVEFWTQIRHLLTPTGSFITQAGNSCLWRCETLKKSWKRMNEVFEHVTYFEVDEQDWVWLVGHANTHKLSVSEMKENLECSRYRPVFIDSESLQRSVMSPRIFRMES